MKRSKPSLSTSERKTKNSIHCPRLSRLLQIVPQRSSTAPGILKSASLSTSGGGLGGEREWKSSATRDTVAIDLDNPLDDRSPASNADVQNANFNAVLGEHRGKGKEEVDSDDVDSLDPFENSTNPRKRMSRAPKGIPTSKRRSGAPEQQITIFVLRLALIEKAASLLGKMAFLWATVVILGGFASTVNLTDFLVVTVIILAESTRVFSRSHELEWGLDIDSARPYLLPKVARSISVQTRKSNSWSKNASRNFKKQRTLSTPSESQIGKQVPLSPDSPSGMRTLTHSSRSTSLQNRGVVATASDKEPLSTLERTSTLVTVTTAKFSSAEMVKPILYVAQLGSATVSIGLSLWRLSSQNLSAPNGSTNSSNVTVSMNVFYVLAVLEAGLFLLQRCYWEYEIRLRRLLEAVCEEDAVGSDNLDIVRHFFHDVFVKCLRGSVVDGLDMDLVSYSISWLQSEDFRRQWAGARLLNRFVSKNDKLRINDRFASDALNRLGTIPGIIERLVEKLCWGSEFEEQLRYEIASILSRLVVYNRNSRFLAVPSSMNAVVSLLTSSTDHVALLNHPFALRLSGLRILKYLCKDRKNCLKIGETVGLLPAIIGFIDGRDSYSFNTEANVPPLVLKGNRKVFKKTLQVLLLLAGTTNSSGSILRRRIAGFVSGLKYLRDVIAFGNDEPELQRLSIEILYYLAMEGDVREMIGATGGVIRSLFKHFANYDLVQGFGRIESADDERIRAERTSVSEKAGEALTRLVLQNKRNNLRLLGLEKKTKNKSVVEVMLNSLIKTEKISSSAAQILRSAMKYADEDTKRAIASGSTPMIARYIWMKDGGSTKSEVYEASLGLASRALQSLDAATYADILNKEHFLDQLIKNLKHSPTTTKCSSIRRYSVELILALIAKDDSFLNAFQRPNVDLRDWLENTLNSISEVENFCLFSGLVGYTRHPEDMEELVERAIAAVDNYHTRSMSSL